MKKLLQTSALALALGLAGASTQALAWWDNPWNSGWGPWSGNGWGSGDFGFNFSVGGNWAGRGWGNYYEPYWGYPYYGYGYYPYPYAYSYSYYAPAAPYYYAPAATPPSTEAK